LDIPQMESLNREGIYAVLNTDRHLGIGASYWSDGISPGNYQMPTEFNREDHDIYIYTDRSVFRPGETVHYRGVVRQRDDMRYLPVEQDTVTVTFNNGEEVKTEEFELTPFGTFSGSFDIVDEAPLGAYYRLEAELMTEDSSAVEIERSVSFAVAEFVPPEFEAEVIPQQDEYVQGETMQIAVDSSYFFGGKVADARVFYRVQAEPYTFNYQGQGRYSFFSYDPYDYRRDDRYGRGTRVAEGAGTSDSNGVYMLELPAELQFDDSSNRIIIEASVRDDSNREINVRGGVIVHAGEIYIGSQPQEYIGNAGRESSIDLIAVDLDSEPVPNQELRVEAVQVKWNNIQERDDLGRTVWTWEEELIPVSDALLTTDENGKAVFTFTPEDGGTYRVVSTTMDSNGNPVSNIANQWVRGSSYVSWRQSNNKRIDLIAGSDNYSVGDTAEILIASPFQGTAQALITVERQGVITHEVITLENNSYVYELPIEEDFAPNIFVSVFVVKGVDDNNPVADFRMGMLQLDVDIEQKIITLDVSADTERAAPQDTVTYTIVATDYNGDPVQAEIGVGVTDRAALAVGAPAGDPMAEHYYSNVGLSVRTATPLTINTDAITQQIIDTLKGGGGGGGGLSFTFEVRGEFVNTPFWEGTVLTDENGEAKVEVTLPDNLTTWRLDARAVTTGEDGITKIGQTTFDLISTRPLLVRPVAPRFFVVGDVMTISAVVNNNTPDDIEATVLLEASGIRLLDESSQTQTITIPADRGKRVDWQVEVLDADSVELIFATESLDGDYNDASRPTLGEGENNLIPIYKYEARETVATGGVIREEGTRTETILLPERYTTNDANLTVTVESSLAAGLEDSLDYLDTYDSRSIPYVVSRFLPNLMTYRALQSLDIENAPMKLRLDETLSWALQRLYNEQKSDGGWGWYLNESSDTNTTAYVLIALG
ncbi:MAG: alpha-2-macroglobulin family protein, partial [Aggregatilineales bacterium]